MIPITIFSNLARLSIMETVSIVYPVRPAAASFTTEPEVLTAGLRAGRCPRADRVASGLTRAGMERAALAQHCWRLLTAGGQHLVLSMGSAGLL
jgi:hypothetical protein